MTRYIDADALERDGWRMSRTVQIDEKTMELQTRKPTDFQAVEPRKGRWKEHDDYQGLAYLCSECGYFTTDRSCFCPHCGAKMDAERKEE